MQRRSLLQALATTPLLATLAPARAQIAADRPIRVVVPFAAGNTLDIALRQVAEVIKANSGLNVIVDAKPGGSGIIAAQTVMQAAPDGHTLLLANTSMFTINPHTFSKLPYDPEKHFKPVTNFLGAAGDGGACQRAGQQPGRVHRLGQGEPGQGVVRVLHRRQLLAFRRRDPEPARRPGHGACALQRHAARGAEPGRRAGECGLPAAAGRQAACRHRQGQGAGDLQPAALAAGAHAADLPRAGLPGARHLHLVLAGGARRHARRRRSPG
jgi:hypothetical protein